ncbi:hypothetical protein FHR55_003924 [Xanthomonas arboricola]
MTSSPIGTRKNKVLRERSSLDQQLLRQLKYLQSSAKLFDAGDHDEANRLATVMRVLLHDTAKSKSLLGLLGIKDDLKFIDTGLYRDRLDEVLNADIDKKHPGMVVAAISPGEAGLVEFSVDYEKRAAGWIAPLREYRFHPLGMV